ncbi:MAG: TonB family protein, partial [Caulobacter sp.]
SAPAPPAARVASNARDTWQGRVLGHLEKHRRYPGNARSRGVQGTAYIRFRMNRGGQMLWAVVQRSSGSSILDEAALDTIRRAQPLPPIPPELPDEVELAAPVEFYLSR